MRRWLSLLAVVMALLAGSLSTVSAQDPATPAAGEEATASVIYGADGEPEGEVTVSSVVDPFEDFDPSSAPQRGFHYVMAIVTITATADRPVEANSYGFYTVDTDGFMNPVTYLYRAQESTDAIPDLVSGTIEAGQSMSGAVFFMALDGTSTALVLYQPSYDRLITAADLRESAVSEGDPVDFLTSDGTPAATITVDGTTSPLKDFSSPPQRGFEFLGVSVTIENTGTQPLQVDPYTFAVTNAEGFVYNYYGAYRTEEGEAQEPSLASAELAAGESVSGLISFQVLAGTEIGVVYYQPSSDRHIRLAEYGDKQAPKPTGTPPASNPNPNPGETATADETPGGLSAIHLDVKVCSIGGVRRLLITVWSEAISAVGGVFTGEPVDPQQPRCG